MTHNGNLNRSEVPATGVEGTSGSKSNDCEATLRKGNLPKAEVVKQVEEKKDACCEAAKKQYEGSTIPTTGKEEAHTSGGK